MVYRRIIDAFCSTLKIAVQCLDEALAIFSRRLNRSAHHETYHSPMFGRSRLLHARIIAVQCNNNLAIYPSHITYGDEANLA
jgi:hypothetical protein